MIARMPRLITEGQHIKLRGHKVRDDLYLNWHKVVSTEGGTLHLIDRHGRTSRLGIDHAERLRWKCVVWEPGDDRNDEDPAVLIS